ncbi:MAG TPA: cell division protein FtsH, partial [Cutibacterium acnes]|nr:cell division protein FtsH [Cutibacterium acnes]
LVAAAMPGTDPVQKITILPRGRALGYTMVMPDSDKYSQTRSELLDSMAYMMGGRAAEELIFHDPSTGASNDIEKATKVARALVTQYGLSARVGTVQLGSGDTEPFLGMTAGQQRDYSDETAKIIDDEVRELLENAHQEAFDCLDANREVLDELVRQLFARETLSKAEVADIFKPLKRWPERGAFTGSDKRVPSSIPPVKPPQIAGVDEDAPEVGAPRRGVIAPPTPEPGGDLPGDNPGEWEPPSDWQPPSVGGGKSPEPPSPTHPGEGPQPPSNGNPWGPPRS